MVSGTWDMFGEELLEEAVMTEPTTAELWQQAITSDDRDLLAERLREAFDSAVEALGYDKLDETNSRAVWGKVVEELDTYAHVHGKVL